MEILYDCPICGEKVSTKEWQPCGPCQYGKKKAVEKRVIQNRETKKRSAVDYRRVGTLFEPGVQLVIDDGGKKLAKCTATQLSVVDGPAVVKWLDENAKFNQKAVEGGFGEQDTILEGGENLTVDFQGSRLSASASEVWLDLQVQDGGGGSDRTSHAQVLVQSSIGIDAGVLGRAIEAAFKLSRTHAKRVLVAKDSTFDGPK